ncbi:MAG TPA: pirin family protein [Sediminibacterium sp.]|nr:pirin family protein [Sediminibacterium sp.]
MPTFLHRANSRGHANFGWLNSYHTFSFGEYHHPERVHFGALRVLNDDTVAGGGGFPRHPHANMEIVSIPLSGDLFHRDSTGREAVIRHNDVQIMSAGSGIEHSEMNASKEETVKFLQIWVFPKEKNIQPRYEQKTFLPENRVNQLLTVVAPDDANALWINQDAWFTLGNLSEGREAEYTLHKTGQGVYVFVLDGNMNVNGIELSARDGLGVPDADALTIKATTATNFLLIEVPMHF